MNAERLLQHYERIADAPDAIARLRRFILDLAVRGKLVPQDANDEPASELLKRIAKEKARLVKAGEARKSEIDPVNEEDAPFTIPLSWRWTRLGSVADWGSGSTPSRGNLDLYGGGIAWLKSGELNDNRALTGSEETVTQLAIEKGSFRINKPGDVLLAMYGATIGKVAILAESAVTNQAVCGCTPFAGVFNQFLFLFLLSQREQFHLASEGGAQPNISKVKIVWTPFPLPPLAEQHRIVAKVDELMGLCDRLEAARAGREAVRDRLASAGLARLNAPDPQTFQNDARFALDALPALTTRPDQIKRLRQTILNLAVRGKLVPQDANDEPASDLLKRIAKEREGPQAVKKARRNGETDVFHLRTDMPLPVGWLWTNIDEISLSMRYGTSTKCEYAAPGVPVLRIPNVSNGVVSLDDIKFGPLADGEIRNLALNAGDLLMIRSNGSLDIVGRSAVVTTEAEGMAFAGYLVRLRLSLANIKPEFIWLALKSTDVRDQIERPIRSAVGLKNVNLTEFGALTIPLPPLAEQHRIVAKVDALMALCDRLEASLTATAATRRRLLEALLAEALAPVDAPEMEAAE
jgi:type I restriction enzyme S subunit